MNVAHEKDGGDVSEGRNLFGKCNTVRVLRLKAFQADGNCRGKQMLDHKFLLFNGSLLTGDHRGTKDVTEAIMQPLQSNMPLEELSGKGDGQGLAHRQWKPEAALISCQQWRSWQGEHMTLSGQVVPVPGGSIRLTFLLLMLLDAHGQTPHTHGTPITPTDAQTHGKHPQEGFRQLTQFYILIISEDEDDVGSHVANVAVSLQPRPEAISRQVARALSRGESSCKD